MPSGRQRGGSGVNSGFFMFSKKTAHICFVLRRYSFAEAHWYAVRTPVWWKQGNTALGESLTREAETNGQFVPKKELFHKREIRLCCVGSNMHHYGVF